MSAVLSAVSRILSLREITVSRGQRRVISSLNLTLQPGNILGVLGPNGAGKTSLLSACTGELPLSEGVIFYGEVRLNPNDASSLARLRAVLPQHSQLTFNLPVEHIIRMGAYPFPEISPVQVDRWFDMVVEGVELSGLVHHSYNALSGGEQQRVQFARVILQTYAIAHTQGHAYLFLDEPTASLDLRHQGRLIKTVQLLAKKQVVSVLIVLHDLNMAARWCDMLLLLSPEHAPVFGNTKDILTKETLRKVYGVDMHIQSHPFRSDELLILSDE